MHWPYTLVTLARRGLLNPGPPHRVAAQFHALRVWGYGLAGELRSAAARSRNAVAIVDERRGEITYGELLRRSERLGLALRGVAEVRAGDRVGLMCRNHAGMVEGMLAASLLGADIVLINTGLSSQQLAAVTEELRLRVLIHDREFSEQVTGVPVRGLGPRRPRPHGTRSELVVERFDEYRVDELIRTAPPGELRPPAREGRTIVLTSGTTGRPKGAWRPTPQGFAPLASVLGRIPLRARSRVLIAAPLFHTWGYAALQVSLALRARIVLQRRFEPAATVQALARYRCNALFAVPVMLQRLLDVPISKRPRLKVVAVSGSPLFGSLATRFMDAYGDVLYNLYGSTEASWVSIARPADLRRAPGTAGRPPYGTRVAILGPDDRPLPPGQVGRIFVGNDMLFEGYTSGSASLPRRDGLLGTGDLGHVDEGLLFVDGREDDMIVSGGENVFPSEVEDLLAGLPQVREVAVVGVADREFGQRLAAYLALHPGERLDAEAVREYVRHYLARFCVPRDVYYIPSLPRNATGKVVTRELPYRW